MALTVKEQAMVNRARRHGIKEAPLAFEVWKNRTPKPAGFDFALICAMLVKETSGGINEFGHDPTIFIGAGLVTKAKYLAYRKQRNLVHKFQGVGGMQLTYGGYQDEADSLGGCWVSRFNYHVGFDVVRRNVKKYGLWAGVAAYNGSGPAARAYANSVLSIRQTFEHLLAVPRLDPGKLGLPSFDEDMDALAQVAKDHADAKSDDPFWLPH